MLRRISALAALWLAVVLLLVPARSFPSSLALAQNTTDLQYVSPLPGSKLVTPGTTIALREGDPIVPESIDANLFNVVGSSSGVHPGSTVLADDGETVIFKPQQPFALGESVSVAVDSGIRTISGQTLDPVSFSFTIFPRQAPLPPLVPAPSPGTTPTAAPSPAVQADDQPIVHPPAPAPRLQPSTLPADLPVVAASSPAGPIAGEGGLFLAPFPFPFGPSNYLMIVDSSGQPIYYQKTDNMAADFKVQPNGLLTYYLDGRFYAMDNTYKIVNTYAAGNGYGADLHDLQLLPNGHALLMIYDAEYVDMSQVVPGGQPDAIVEGLVVQELDAAQNVVFQWRSWDHFQIADTYEDMTKPTVDYVHGNSIQLDTDGSLLLSSRHLSEITKINRKTGDVIWRWGGKNNEFTFVDDNSVPAFFYQHDVRRQSNGDITVFDNRTALTPVYSDALEFKLDEINKTATLVWQYRHSPDVYALAMGNIQYLPNGHRLIDWGTAGVVTELYPDGTTAADWVLSAPDSTYRAFRYTWHATPQYPPTLIGQNDSHNVTLTFSWNGATDVAAYRVYGGPSPDPTDLLATESRAGFDTQIVLPYDSGQCFYYRVLPVDIQGNTMTYSNQVTTCH